LAVTSNGELYGWGANINTKLGMAPDTVLIGKPTPVPFFCDKSRFKVIDVACGDEHSLVHVEEFDEFGQSLGYRLYQMGFNPDETDHTYRGATKEELEANQGIVRLAKFDNLSIQCMGAGHNTSFVYFIPPTMNDKDNWISQNIQNETCPGITKKGYLHFYFSKEQ
jgi:alpha-tubulin suppressor-like RCC1 family protein